MNGNRRFRENIFFGKYQVGIWKTPFTVNDKDEEDTEISDAAPPVIIYNNATLDILHQFSSKTLLVKIISDLFHFEEKP